MIVVGLYFLVVALIGVFCVAVRRQRAKPLPAPKKAKYIDYSTAELINEVWDGRLNVGKCFECGMDDMPRYHSVCVWCMEFKNISHHLKGKRRIRRIP